MLVVVVLLLLLAPFGGGGWKAAFECFRKPVGAVSAQQTCAHVLHCKATTNGSR